jgi:hypothetical protein
MEIGAEIRRRVEVQTFKIRINNYSLASIDDESTAGNKCTVMIDFLNFQVTGVNAIEASSVKNQIYDRKGKIKP